MRHARPHAVELGTGERKKVALLSTWFFIAVATLWLLKPLRSATLIAHLGAVEIPYVRLASVVAVGVVTLGYSRIVPRLRRLDVARGATLVFGAVFFVIWTGLEVRGESLGAQRWFVWAVFILVDVYSTVMIGIFWTYTNDVVTSSEADRVYGPIGLGGILGGIAGGVFVDTAVESIGAVHLLLVCVILSIAGALLVTMAERHVKRATEERHEKEERRGDLLSGAREVWRSSYLRLIVGVVIAYEFAAAMTDFVVNVVFERAFTDQVRLAQMFGRLGWIVSATALVSQLVLVPVLLPAKRVALLVPPLAMGLAAGGLMIVPCVGTAILLSAADRGLNYSLQQVTKETLYVPLTAAQRYEGKAFVDMFVDRLGKSLSALSLIGAVAFVGMSITAFMLVACAALVVWTLCAAQLGRVYRSRGHGHPDAAPSDCPDITKGDT